MRNYQSRKIIKIAIGILIVFSMIAAIYGPWFSSQMIARGDWKARSGEWMSDYRTPPSIWDHSDFGGVSFLYNGRITRYPLFYLQAQLHQQLGLSFKWTERILWFFPFIIFSFLSMYLLSRYLFKNNLVAFFSIIYFISNNFIVFRMHGAQMTLGMAYALTPLALFLFIKGLKERKFIFIFLNGLSLSIMAYYDFRIIFLVIFIQFLYLCYYSFILSSEKIVSFYLGIKSFCLIGILFLFLNIFWILPLILSNLKASIPFSPFSFQEVITRTDFYNALVLSIGANSSLKGYLYLDQQIFTGLLVFLHMIIYGFYLLIKDKKEIAFWMLLSIFLAFFAKGLSAPFPEINSLFYQYMPFASIYRLPSKFLIVGGTSISLCFGAGCNALLSRMKRPKQHLILFLFLTLLPLFIIFPALFGPNSLKSMEGGSSFHPFVAKEYFQYEKWLKNQSSHYKVAVLPGTPSYYFFNNRFPRYEPLTNIQRRSEVGSYFSEITNIYKLSLVNEKNISKALELINVKYVFLAPRDDTLWPWYPKDSYNKYTKKLLESEGLKRTKLDNIFTTTNPLPNFFISQKLLYIDGSLDHILSYFRDKKIDFEKSTLLDKQKESFVKPDHVAIAVSLNKFCPENNTFTLEVNLPKIDNYFIYFKQFSEHIGYIEINGKRVERSSEKNTFFIKTSFIKEGINVIDVAALSSEDAGKLINKHFIIADRSIQNVSSSGSVNVVSKEAGRARYKIQIYNSPKGKFYLNFLDSYDSNWKINEGDKALLSACGTNYFLIRNKEGDAHLEFVLEHMLQKHLDVGWRIFQISWISVAIYLLFRLIRRINYRKRA
ncbi:MAG: hypothetical protein P9M07_01700 [Candidatus Aceula meridiana]|nr:hypothetical protein [Candidatus Aceula meridiana]